MMSATFRESCYERCGFELATDAALALPSKELLVRNLNRLMRGKKNISLAEAAGVSSGTVTNWRKGKILPEVSRLTLIADFLGVSVSEMFTDETDPRTWAKELTIEEAIRIVTEAARASQSSRKTP